MSKNMNLIMENWRKFSNDTTAFEANISNINSLCLKLEKLQQNKSLLENKKLLLEEKKLLKEAFENIKSLFSKTFSSGNPKTEDVAAITTSLEKVKNVTRSPLKKALINQLSILALAASLLFPNIAKAWSAADMVDFKTRIQKIIRDKNTSAEDKENAQKMLSYLSNPDDAPKEIKKLFKSLYEKMEEDVRRQMQSGEPDLGGPMGIDQIQSGEPDLGGPMGVDLLDAANTAANAVSQAASTATQVSTAVYNTVGDVSRNIFNSKQMFEDTIKKLKIDLQQIQTAQGVVNTILNKLVGGGLISSEQRNKYASGPFASKWTETVRQFTNKP